MKVAKRDLAALAMYRTITDATTDDAIDDADLSRVTFEQVGRFVALGWVERPATTVRRANNHRLTAAGRAALETGKAPKVKP